MGNVLTLACTAQLPQFVLDAPTALLPVSATQFRIADFDNDGDQDLLTVGTSLTLLFNDGDVDGRLSMRDVTGARVDPALTGYGSSAAAADFDGDGDIDLMLGGLPTVVAWNDGSGNFAPGTPIAGVDSPDEITPTDLDGDGDIDLLLTWVLAASTPVTGAVVLVNDGSGSFSIGTSFGAFSATTAFVLDYDEDGDGDLFLLRFVSQSPTNQLFRNDGAMSFTDVTATDLAVAPTYYPTPGAVGDIDGDGHDELILGAGQNCYVLDSVGGVLTASATVPSLLYGTQSIALGDIDGDGDLDLLHGGYASNIALSLNDGVGGFSWAPYGRLPLQTIVTEQHELVDLDGDGDLDIVSNTSSWNPLVLRNRDIDLTVGTAATNTTWQLTLRSRPGYATASEPALLAIGLAALPQPVALPGLGALRLDLSGPVTSFGGLLTRPNGSASFGFAIPDSPALVGLDLHAQGLVARGGGTVRLTALRSVFVH